MKPVYPLSSSRQKLAIARGARWQVYQRLCELDIPCSCIENGDLYADIANPVAAVQLHSVVRQFTAPRMMLIDWLEACWRHK
jgi:hypothetical protein